MHSRGGVTVFAKNAAAAAERCMLSSSGSQLNRDIKNAVDTLDKHSRIFERNAFHEQRRGARDGRRSEMGRAVGDEKARRPRHWRASRQTDEPRTIGRHRASPNGRLFDLKGLCGSEERVLIRLRDQERID